MDYTDNFNEYLNLLTTNVKRDGIENLINYLKKSDAQIAPASTKYHLSTKGGLILHSLNVYKRLKRLMNMEFGDKCPYSEETLVIVSLLHDISKVNFYEVYDKNIKDSSGNWTKVQAYKVREEDSRFIFGGHAMNSYYMINTFIQLTYDESLAILHHMGGIDTSEDTISVKNLSEAYKKSKLALLLHMADMLSTFGDESEEGLINE